MNKGIFKLSKYKNINKMLLKYIILVTIESISIVILFPYFYNMILNEKLNSGNLKEILIFGVMFILLGIFRCLFAYLGDMEKNKCKIKIGDNLRKDTYFKLQKEKISYYDTNRNSDIFELLVNDNEEASNLFPGSFMKLYVIGLFRAVVLIIIMLILDYKLGLITILIYLIGYAIIISANKISIKIIDKKRNVIMNMVNYTNETVEGFETVKTLGIEEERENKLKKLISSFICYTSDLDKVTRVYTFIYQIIIFFITISNIYIGSMDIITGVCTYASLVLIIQYSQNAGNYLDWIVEGMPIYNSNKLAFNKILNYIDNSDLEDLENGKNIEKVNSIEYKNVEFAYDDKNIIENFSLKVNEGEKIALIGKTGSGKTTIVNLLCRFYDINKGSILINGENINDLNISNLRHKIGYVMQESYIFEGTVLENINYANKQVKKEDVIKICKKLRLHDKIMSLEKGYETILKENSNILSSGESQLLNFARIMVLDPDIIILDEATSSLSYNTEMLIQEAIRTITEGKICFIIAHRLSTIKDCNKIIILDKGKIIEEGTHEELINRKGRYYNLVNNIV